MKNPTSSEILASQKSMCNYLKIFWFSQLFKLDAVALEWLANGTALGQYGLNSFEGKIPTNSQAGLNHYISGLSSQKLIGAGNFLYV